MEHFHAKDGRRLAYRDSGGDGRPILCLGGLTRNGRDFDCVCARLGGRFRVLRLDSRGRGGSERAEDPLAEYAVPTEAADAMALLDHLGIARTAIIGTSRGGILGMSIAAGRPGLVSALVLNDVGAVIEMGGLLRIMVGLGRPPRAASFEAAGEALRQENARGFPDVPLERWIEHAHAIYDDDHGRPVLAYDPKLRFAVGAAIEGQTDRLSLWPLFEALDAVPILVLRGENSDILTRDTVAAMRAHRPDIQCVEVAGRGHAPFLDEPEAIAAIEAFLETYA